MLHQDAIMLTSVRKQWLLSGLQHYSGVFVVVNLNIWKMGGLSECRLCYSMGTITDISLQMCISNIKNACAVVLLQQRW